MLVLVVMSILFYLRGLEKSRAGIYLNLVKNGGLPGYDLLICDILTFFQNSVYRGNDKREKASRIRDGENSNTTVGDVYGKNTEQQH